MRKRESGLINHTVLGKLVIITSSRGIGGRMEEAVELRTRKSPVSVERLLRHVLLLL